MKTPLNIGIIGLGKMGRARYQEFVKHPHTVVTHVADPNSELFVDYPGVECFTDAQQVIESAVDAILVATPNRFTPELVIAALDAGKHVFSEKPPGRTLEDIEGIIEAEQRTPGLKLKFGFNHRYHSGIQEAKRIVDSGTLGHIMWLRGVYGKSGGEGFEDAWRSDESLGGSGILLDQGIHMLDLFRFFSGDFTEVKGMVTTAYWDIPMEDNAFALLRNEQGTVAMLHSSSTQWKNKFSLEIYCRDGLLSVNGILTPSRSYGDETISVARRQFDDGFTVGKPDVETIYFDTDPSSALEIEDFVDCILNDKSVTSGTSDDALKVMQLVFSIYEDDQ